MSLSHVAEDYLECMEEFLKTDGWAEKLKFADAIKDWMGEWRMVLKNRIKKKGLKHFNEFDFNGYNCDSFLVTENITDCFPKSWRLRFSLCIDNAHITDNGITIIPDAEVKFAMELVIGEKIHLKKKQMMQDAKQTIINCITDKLKIEKDDWSDDSVLNSKYFLFWMRFSNLVELYNKGGDIQQAAQQDVLKIIKFCKAIQENGKEFFDCVSKCLDKYYFRGIEATIMEKIEKIFQNVSKQVILYGPPGTGKTYLAKQAAAHLLGLPPDAATDEKNEKYHKIFKDAMFGKDNVDHSQPEAKGKWAIVQFHPSYNYEDFVRGIAAHTKENQIEYTVVDRIFAKMCKKARQDKDKDTKYILIIDEINRANLAAVLGELIYAMEYRGEAVDTPYKNEKTSKLTIPDNLYIIGTMNTADRSIGHIDYAVRRRFAFYQLLPDPSIISYANENDIKDKALTLFKNVAKLFGVEANDGSNLIKGEDGILSQDYYWEDVLPGHSYLIAKDIDELAYKFAYQVWPLLMEYYKDGVFTKNPCQELLQKDNPNPSVDDLIQYVENLSN